MTTTSSNTTPAATPTKLRNGSWGATVRGTVSVGDRVTITTRGGKSWDAEVTRVVWSGPARDGSGTVAICATASLDRAPRRRRRSSSGECLCGACDDLLSVGYRPGQRVRCPECGGWAEAC